MKIDNALFEIQRKLWKKYSISESEKMIAPLLWYINTGRASAQFENLIINATARQKATIANRLAKHYLRPYDDAINSICAYIGYRRNN